jgi:hypothetical protein
MVVTLRGDDANAIRAMPQLVSEGAWCDQALLERHWCEVDQTLGDEDGVLTLDGSDLLKQGQESVGGKRHYCGEGGKRATCQAGVFLGYASVHGYTLLDRRLSLPTEWVEDDAWAPRPRRCGVPPQPSLQDEASVGLGHDSRGGGPPEAARSVGDV